jgi:hypothetical protein
MAIPAWPAINDTPLVDGFQNQPWGPGPIITQMEGGNVRTRRRPGDNISLIKQAVRLSDADLATFKTWFDTTLGGGAARFTMDVWTGIAFENKVCQFDLSSPVQFNYVVDDATDVVMSLRVYI